LSHYLENPLLIPAIWEGGIAVYGAFIGGLVGGFIAAWRSHLDPWPLLDIAAPVDEQARRAVLDEVGDAGRTVRIGERQARERDHVLAPQAQDRPAGHQQLDPRGRGQEVRDRQRRRQHVLEVVQHE